MNQISVAHSRGPQILTLLNEYGPLSVKGLETILRPRIAKRRLQEALLRLYEKGLVIRRFEASPFSRQYYELSQSDSMREEVHKLTGIPLERLIQPYFRSQELLHSEECTHWAYYLKELFPDAEVVRDFRLKDHKKICNALMIDEKNPEILPDIVLYFFENADQDRLVIPIEIELSRKSDARLYRKLKKYSSQSYADGLIYLCHKNTLISTVKSIYAKSFATNGSAMAHYGHYFLLLGDRTFNAETGEPNLLTHEGKIVSLRKWIIILRADKRNFRRNEKFAKPA